jgi:hypothetical protein
MVSIGIVCISGGLLANGGGEVIVGGNDYTLIDRKAGWPFIVSRSDEPKKKLWTNAVRRRMAESSYIRANLLLQKRMEGICVDCDSLIQKGVLAPSTGLEEPCKEAGSWDEYDSIAFNGQMENK